MAGYWGLNYVPESISSATIALTNECATDWATDYKNPLTSVNNDNTGYTTCIPEADHKDNTDILTVRHVASEPIAIGTTTISGGIFLITSLTEGSAFQAAANDELSLTYLEGKKLLPSEPPFALYQVLAHAYYIRPWSQSADEDPLIPTLVREVISGNAVTAVPLIEYVEDFQITFGLDTDGNGSVDLYDNNGIDAGVIDSVMTIEVEILVRSPNVEANYTNTRSYQLGDRVYNVNDGFRRQVFRDAIHLRNWSGLST